MHLHAIPDVLQEKSKEEVTSITVNVKAPEPMEIDNNDPIPTDREKEGTESAVADFVDKLEGVSGKLATLAGVVDKRPEPNGNLGKETSVPAVVVKEEDLSESTIKEDDDDVQPELQLEFEKMHEASTALEAIAAPNTKAVKQNGTPKKKKKSPRKRSGAPVEPAPVDYIVKFPLTLTPHLRSRWSQARFENGQRFLFQTLLNRQAFTQETSIRRSILREGVRGMGIGDLGLIDHVIKHLTAEPVIFLGYCIKKQHNGQGVLNYWLEKAPHTGEYVAEDDETYIPVPAPVPAPTPAPVPVPAVKRKSPVKTRHVKPSLVEEIKSTAELPRAVLGTLKEIRTMLASFQGEFGQASKKRRKLDETYGDGADGEEGASEDWAFNVIMQHAREEIEQSVERYKKDLASVIETNKSDWDELKVKYDNKIQACVPREDLVKEIEQMKDMISKRSPASQRATGSPGEARNHRHLEGSVEEELRTFKTEIESMKVQVRKHLSMLLLCVALTHGHNSTSYS